MAYSFMTAVSDGTLKSMPITFNYMKEDDLVVHHNVTRLTKGIDYTINNNIITFAKVIPALDRIAVDRMSQRDSLRVNFVEGATFSRENMDDVLTQMLYLTQEAMEGSVDRISPTGVLDLAGNRIINLGDPVDLQDAVPLHLVVDAEKSVYASEAKCKQYRDEALGYKDEAFTYADRAYASELNAKKSEEIALQLLAESAEASKLVTENLPEMRELAASAEESADRAGAMVDMVEDALVAVEEYDDRLIAVENKKYTAKDVGAIDKGVVSAIMGGSGYRTLKVVVEAVQGILWGSFDVEIYSGYYNWNCWGSDKFTVAFWSNSPSDAGGCRVVRVSSTTNVLHTFSVGGCKREPDGSVSFLVHTLMTSANNTDIHVYNSSFQRGSINVQNMTTEPQPDGSAFEVIETYNTRYKPTPSAIGAVSSSNVVGTLAEGALFEKYYTPDGWTVIKRIDGTMEMVKALTFNGTTNTKGDIKVSNSMPLPEPFTDLPCFGSSSGKTTGWQFIDVYLTAPVSSHNTGDVYVHFPQFRGDISGSITIRLTGFHANGLSTLEEPEVEDNTPSTLEEPPILDTPQVLPYDPEI